MPNKAHSKKQFRFLQAVAHGGIAGAGLSKREAAELVAGSRYSALPDKAHTDKDRKRGFKKLG